MRILGGRLSPFVMRAVLAARMKGLDTLIETPEGGTRTPDYLALNPMGKMPTFVDGDFALPESGVIAEYLEDLLDGPSLLPDLPEGRALVRLLARVADLYLVPAMTPLFQAQQNPAAVPDAMAKFREAPGHLEALRPAEAEWVGSDEHSLADAALMPLFFFIDVFEAPFGTATMLKDFPGLAAWWERAAASEHGLRMEQEMAAALADFMASRG